MLQNTFNSTETVTKKEQVKFIYQAFVEGIISKIDTSIGKYGDEIMFAKVYIERGNPQEKIYVEHIKISSKNPLVVKDFKERAKVGMHVKIFGNVYNYKNSTTGDAITSIEPKQVFFGEVIQGMKEEFDSFETSKNELHKKVENSIFSPEENTNVVSY